jgi:hypothetical protein
MIPKKFRRTKYKKHETKTETVMAYQTRNGK